MLKPSCGHPQIPLVSISRFLVLPVPVVLAAAEDELHMVGVQLLEVGSILQALLRRTEFSRWRLLPQ